MNSSAVYSGGSKISYSLKFQAEPRLGVLVLNLPRTALNAVPLVAGMILDVGLVMYYRVVCFISRLIYMKGEMVEACTCLIGWRLCCVPILASFEFVQLANSPVSSVFVKVTKITGEIYAVVVQLPFDFPLT